MMTPDHRCSHCERPLTNASSGSSATAARPEVCPHCGAPLQPPTAASAGPPPAPPSPATPPWTRRQRDALQQRRQIFVAVCGALLLAVIAIVLAQMTG